MQLTNKAGLLCFLKILEEYSDEDNILTMKKIQQLMKSEYGLTPDRKTIYSHADMLDMMGYDISKFEDNGKGYYLASRELDTSEVRALMDCVYTNNALPKVHSERLIEKIQKLLPIHKRRKYVITSPRRTPNKSTFFNIDEIDRAITDKKKVEFVYNKYDTNKKLIPTRTEKYLVSPYALVAAEGVYYLVGKGQHHDTLSNYRLDKITEIKEMNENAEPKPVGFDIQKYMDESVFMFSGETVSATMHCKNNMIGYVIDKFGRNATLIPDKDGETFTLHVHGSYMGLRFWATHYFESVEVIEPENMREEIVSAIKNDNMYGLKIK